MPHGSPAELTFSEPMTFFMGRVYNVFVLSPLYDVYAIYVVFKVWVERSLEFLNLQSIPAFIIVLQAIVPALRNDSFIHSLEDWHSLVYQRRTWRTVHAALSGE